MTTIPTLTNLQSRWFSFVLIIFLSSPMFAPERDWVNLAFNYSVLTTAIYAAYLFWPALKTTLKQWPIYLYLLFSIYMITSSYWGDGELFAQLRGTGKMLIFFFFCVLISDQLENRRSWYWLIIAGALYMGWLYLLQFKFNTNVGWNYRLTGHGALYLPILTGGYMGGIFVLGLSGLAHDSNSPPWLKAIMIAALLIVGYTVLKTDTRSAIGGIVLSSISLAIFHPSKTQHKLIFIALLAAIYGALFYLFYDTFTARGDSLRFSIWSDAWMQISEAPWFGHGLGTRMRVMGGTLAHVDAHNYWLTLWLQSGVVGVTLWFVFATPLYIRLLLCPPSAARSTALALSLYAFCVMFFEGSGIMARPSERWLTQWIPIALAMAEVLRSRRPVDTESNYNQPSPKNQGETNLT